MPAEIFLTGATGFLGSRLLRELLTTTTSRFWLLVRSPASQDALLRKIQASDRHRLQFVQGDVTRPWLGLDDRVLASLAHSVNEIWHLAASTSFDESKRDETFHINVAGTRNLLAVASRFARLDVFYHMSTAYVCGRKLGPIPEGPFEVTEGFKNPYEESKSESEKLVYSSGLPVVVVRPSITIGDSETGDCGGDNRMLYGYALGLLRAAMHAFDSSAAFWDYWCDGHTPADPLKNVNARLLVRPEATKNVVTVDDVVSVCLAIRRSGTVKGKTFNVINPANLKCSQIVDAISRVLRVVGYRTDPGLGSGDARRGTLVERAAYRYTRLFFPYCLNTEPDWKTHTVDGLGVERVIMTESLFEFMMKTFLQQVAAGVNTDSPPPHASSSRASKPVLRSGNSGL